MYRAAGGGSIRACLGAALIGSLAALSAVPFGAARAAEPSTTPADATKPLPVRGMVVDPADYLSEEPDAQVLAERLIDQLHRNGANTLYLNAYNVEYGAYYETDYLHNVESPYGRQDLLGRVIKEAHARDIDVYAGIYDHQHRQAWEENPSWRAKTRSGGDYSPQGTDVQHFLSVAHEEAGAWWRGFLTDLLNRYPDLDGIEIREPVVNWWGTSADYNPAATRAFRTRYPDEPLGGEKWRRFRQELLTKFMTREIALIRRAGRQAHVTTVASALEDGHLMTASAQAWETGFDLEALLKSPDRPDAIKTEIIWQQWAGVYGYVTFTPEWTGDALEEFVDQVDGRIPVIAHIELTDFGSRPLSRDEFRRALASVHMPGVSGVDVYSSKLADIKEAWPVLRERFVGEEPDAYTGTPRALVLYDGKHGALAKIAATNLVNLLGHFDVSWRMQPVEEYDAGELDDYEFLFYHGAVFENAPDVFLKDAVEFKGEITWIGRNLHQLEKSGADVPLYQETQDAVVNNGVVRYDGRTIPSKGEIVVTETLEGANVLADVRTEDGWAPYAVHAGRLWYFAGSPFDYLEGTNGRYLLFADLLHDVLGQGHEPERRAFVRIEDVNPETDPKALRRVADIFADRKMPFMVGVFPFYLDPATKTNVKLSERPDLVRALRYMVGKGGSIILHGSSHQYKGKSGIDWEFWDPKTAGGVPEDGPAYVDKKVTDALHEAWANDIHPLAWETPHYGATAFDYARFGAYFSTFVERRMYGVWDGTDYQQAMPYIVESDVYGGRIIPENLDYVREPADADRIIRDAASLSVVRDAVAGAFVHPTVDAEIVDRIADGLGKLDFGPLDLAKLPNTVRTSKRVETTGQGPIELPVPSGHFLEERVLDRQGNELSVEKRKMLSYSRVNRTFDRAGSGEILSLAIDPPPLPSGGILLVLRTVGDGVDDGVVAVGLLGLVLLFTAYGRLRVEGPVSVPALTMTFQSDPPPPTLHLGTWKRPRSPVRQLARWGSLIVGMVGFAISRGTKVRP